MSGGHQMLLGAGGDTEIVTVATWVFGYATYYGYANTPTFPNNGAISNGYLSSSGGAKINELNSNSYISAYVTLAVDGTVANSGWETMTVTAGGVATALKRSEATFSAGTTTTWTWPVATNNTFGTTVGATATCVFS